jgi:hypothetical protein
MSFYRDSISRGHCPGLFHSYGKRNFFSGEVSPRDSAFFATLDVCFFMREKSMRNFGFILTLATHLLRNDNQTIPTRLLRKVVESKELCKNLALDVLLLVSIHVSEKTVFSQVDVWYFLMFICLHDLNPIRSHDWST